MDKRLQKNKNKHENYKSYILNGIHAGIYSRKLVSKIETTNDMEIKIQLTGYVKMSCEKTRFHLS